MAMESKGACIWHAFNALDEQQTGEVNKSQLKVLSHNICMSVGIPSVMANIALLLKSMDEHTQNSHLTFLEFYFFIKTELFDKIRNSGEINANTDLTKCDEICWLVCLRKYLHRDLKIIEDKDAFKLFQLFNFLAEVEPSGAVACPVVMDAEEVELFAQKFCKIIGFEYDDEEFQRIAKEIVTFNYQQLLVLLETQYCTTADHNLISSAINEIHDEFLVEVIKKGFLTKKGQRVGSWKERWFVLTPRTISYFVGRDEKDKKGDLPIISNGTVEVLPDRPDKFSKTHTYKFVYHSDLRSIEMGASDIRTRSEWVTALKNAIQYCNKPQSLQQMALSKRRQLREQRRKKEQEDEEARKQNEAAIEKTRQELEALQQAKKQAEERIKEEEKLREENIAQSKEEKERLEREMQKKIEDLGLAHAQAEEKRKELEQKRQDKERREKEKVEQELMEARKKTEEVNARLAKEEELRVALQNRITELETLQSELEKHLQEEVQAKRDEEIVRNAQARVLNEEIEKREELEKLQKQLDNLLKEEVQKRIDIEAEKAKQEESLKRSLDSLENEKKALDEKLMEAQEKMEKAKEEKETVQDKMNVKQKEKVSFMARLNKLLRPSDKDPNPTTHRGVGAITANECVVRERLFSSERILSVPNDESKSSQSDSPRSPEDTDMPIVDAVWDSLQQKTNQNEAEVEEYTVKIDDDALETEKSETDVKAEDGNVFENEKSETDVKGEKENVFGTEKSETDVKVEKDNVFETEKIETDVKGVKENEFEIVKSETDLKGDRETEEVSDELREASEI